MDLERLADCRVVPFLLELLAHRRESAEVSSHVLKQLRNGRLTPPRGRWLPTPLIHIPSDSGFQELRLDAAVALGEFTDVAGVPAALGGMTLDMALLIDLRYSAFTSLERAGPTAECIAFLRRLSTYETLAAAQRAF